MANASSVACNLGGGANGHLGLVINAAEYATISPTPYIRPTMPGPLIYPAGMPQYQRSELCEDNKEAIRLFREAEDLKKFLFKQLKDAIPDMYLKGFRNHSLFLISQCLCISTLS